ncbi:ribonuclease J [Govanella unica]|uniref:Ribonuclease J n=1 Tax=Govanella unica TaxID=2975056 RepID=A0A9X3Z712_9PROT|nr:ribonuclease J [Govania unica]MDA5193755.1 ribonuclease J [Govania unica]
MTSKDLLFVPLGGTGEIGMNLNLYGYNDRWIMIDLGISFADDHLPGIEVIMPDPAFIVERRDKLQALFVTHAHEDHAGAVAHLWPQLRCPVYATPFTIAILRAKLKEAGLLDQVPLHEVPLGGQVTVGDFTVDYVSLTHSIPEPNALLITTPVGKIFHTGDWKLDPGPVIGEPTDELALRAIGQSGILAMICDSTNVFNKQGSGSETEVRDSLVDVVAGHKGRVIVTTFASNVARLDSIAAAAAANGRHICLLGRSLVRNVEIARSLGYLQDMPPVVAEEDAGYLPKDKVLYISTGCQGEPRAALSRIVAGQHRHVSISPGDVVVFSSKIIPGNDISIGRMINQLVKAGAEVITEKDAFIHVSGHPGQGDLEQMYDWIKPQVAVPVHGEARHLLKHAAFAREWGVPQVITAENGSVVRLAPGPAKIIEVVDTGRLALDGKVLVAADGLEIAERRRIMHHGYVGVAVAVDENGELVADPCVDLQGVPAKDADDLIDDILDAVEDAIERMSKADRRKDDRMSEALRVVVRRVARDATGKQPGPITKVHLLRVD